MQKIKKGDDVIVITGKDKGKRGTVLRVAGIDLIVVDGVNKVKKHQSPNPKDRKSTRLNSSHAIPSRMPSSA